MDHTPHSVRGINTPSQSGQRLIRQRYVHAGNETLSNSQADVRPSPRERHKPVHRSPGQRSQRRQGNGNRPFPQQHPMAQGQGNVADMRWFNPYAAYQYSYPPPPPIMSHFNPNQVQEFMSESQSQDNEVSTGSGSGSGQANDVKIKQNYSGQRFPPYMPYGHGGQLHPMFAQAQQGRVNQQPFFPSQNNTEQKENSGSSESSSDYEDKAPPPVNERFMPRHAPKFEYTTSGQDSSSSYEASKSNNTFVSNFSQVSRGSPNTNMSNIDVTSNSLLSAVGSVATSISSGVGEIDLQLIDWNEVASKLQQETAESCEKRWKEQFPNHKCTRLPHGVVIYCRSTGNGLNSSDGDNSAGMCGSSFTGSNNRRRGVSTEPNSNSSSGNNGGNVQTMQNGSNSSENSASAFVRSNASSLNHFQTLGTMNQQFTSSGSDSSKRKRARRPWTVEEQSRIEDLQKKFGNKWTLIAETMNSGRSGTEVKNFWHNKKQKLAMRLLKQQE